MKYRMVITLSICMYANTLFCQAAECNQLGVWLWHIETTQYPTFVNLANDLSDLGVKRVYVKVADGQVDSLYWPELVDTFIIKILENHDIEPWAWSYNYKGNVEKQAEALYTAAKTGYKGYVVDIESEFDNEVLELNQLLGAFYSARQTVLSDGIATDSFPLYLTTWGNPQDHNFHIEIADAYVDAFMPQTYIENWGPSYLAQPDYWVAYGNQEYRDLGATKPIHHIISMEQGSVSADHVNAFFQASGPESSIWRIPGGGTPLSIRDVWDAVDWDKDFCATTATSDPSSLSRGMPIAYPNPITDSGLTVTLPFAADWHIVCTDMYGRILFQNHFSGNSVRLDTSTLPYGMNVIRCATKSYSQALKVIKIESK